MIAMIPIQLCYENDILYTCKSKSEMEDDETIASRSEHRAITEDDTILTCNFN